MKLFLMRHAHTEQALNKPDIERNLTDRGIVEAEEAADFLVGEEIDKIIISYALRAAQTGDVIRKKLPAVQIQVITELYHEKRDDILNILSKQNDNNKNILVIGHNPLIYNLALELACSNSARYEFLSCSLMTTAQIVVIDFPPTHKWYDIENIQGEISKIFIPNTGNCF